MLESVNLNDRTYAELLEEAILEIPLHGSEWTNFNASDPGVTILQNLTSFQFLQHTAINTVTDAIRLKLLKLLGYAAEDARAATILAEASAAANIMAREKFRVGELIFETERAEKYRPLRISAVFGERDGRYTELTPLLERSLLAGAAAFGSPAREGAALLCVFEGTADFAQKNIFFIRVLDEPRRNWFKECNPPLFAELLWQLYTADGWRDLVVTDGTHGLLVSGEIIIEASQLQPARFSGAPVAGMALRCLLKSGQYDFSPRIHSITGGLMRLSQRDSKAIMLLRGGRTEIPLNINTTLYPYITVYVREQAGEPYREYRPYSGGDAGGRYYLLTLNPDGSARIVFDHQRFGFSPDGGKKSVAIVCCTEEMAYYRSLGKVYGYIGQELTIDFTENILPEDFCVAVGAVQNGLEGYSFVKPGEPGEGGFLYELDARAGKLIIREPGAGGGLNIYVASCAVTVGARGNIHEENRLVPAAGDVSLPPPPLVNPAPGRGGVDAITAEMLRRRFANEMKEPLPLVTAADYEQAVLKTPGLCIHKVKAVAERNLLSIVVKPHADTGFPQVSSVYLAALHKSLMPRRMLTTMFRLVQPVYAPIDVRAAIHVKSRYENARAEIEKILREALDQVSGETGFGETVRFGEIFQRLVSLDCVYAVNHLALMPRPGSETRLRGLDVVPDWNCLCYPGEMSLDLSTKGDR